MPRGALLRQAEVCQVVTGVLLNPAESSLDSSHKGLTLVDL